jgi:hypothetical protein
MWTYCQLWNESWKGGFYLEGGLQTRNIIAVSDDYLSTFCCKLLGRVARSIAGDGSDLVFRIFQESRDDGASLDARGSNHYNELCHNALGSGSGFFLLEMKEECRTNGSSYAERVLSLIETLYIQSISLNRGAKFQILKFLLTDWENCRPPLDALSLDVRTNDANPGQWLPGPIQDISKA